MIFNPILPVTSAPMAHKIWSLWRESSVMQPINQYIKFDQKTKNKMTARARYLRRNKDGEEYPLQFLLRKNNERNVWRKFLVGRCVVDYAIPQRNLIILVTEPDTASGSQFARRKAWLEKIGFTVMGVAAVEVREAPSKVIASIQAHQESKTNVKRFTGMLRKAKRESYHIKHN